MPGNPLCNGPAIDLNSRDNGSAYFTEPILLESQDRRVSIPFHVFESYEFGTNDDTFLYGAIRSVN